MVNTKHQLHFSKAARWVILPMLVFACFSVFFAAQEIYTVNRPAMSTIPKDLSGENRQRAAVPWGTDYRYATLAAQSSSRYLLIYLQADNTDDASVVAACEEFETLVLNDDSVRSGLDRFILLKMPMNAKIPDKDGGKSPIVSLPGIEHMAGHPGLVVIDFENRDTPYYSQVTGILPFWQSVCPTAAQTATFLELPPGTLSQRTLTYAVRIHPDRPLSSDGEPLPIVVQTATDHALFQAERGILGHHNFGLRSQHVKSVLGEGKPSEICAQTQSYESMFEAAIACMRLWRYSSAHWSVARKNQRYYGYDMARSSKNGAWYGVGFFID